MEYAEKGTLERVIKHVRPIPIETVRFMTAEIVLALETLHEVDVAHRDLKPGNILLDEKYHVKLCDFGEAKHMPNIDRDALCCEF